MACQPQLVVRGFSETQAVSNLSCWEAMVRSLDELTRRRPRLRETFITIDIRRRVLSCLTAGCCREKVFTLTSMDIDRYERLRLRSWDTLLVIHHSKRDTGGILVLAFDSEVDMACVANTIDYILAGDHRLR